MEIPEEHIQTIKTSLQYSIRNVSEYHERVRAEVQAQGGEWPKEIQETSLQPIIDALEYIRNNK